MNNWRGVAIVMIGDFTRHPPTQAQLASLKEVCGEIEFAMGKPLKKVRHSDVQNTSCPGDTSRGPGNWFDACFAKPPEPSREALEARITLVEQQRAAGAKLLSNVLARLEETVAFIRLNM